MTENAEIIDDNVDAGAETPPVDTGAETPPVEGETPPAGDGEAPLTATGGDDDTEITPQADWPADWKEKLAGDDDALMKQASRYGSVKDALKAGFAAQQKLREGAHKSAEAPADDASDEEKAAYREANGVPKTAADYNLDLDDGMVVGAEDRPYVDKMLEGFHARNMSDADAKGVLNDYFAMREAQVAEQIEFDNSVRGETVETLRQEYGPEYKANFNKSLNFMQSQFGDDFANEIMSARVEGGARLGDTVDFNSKILELANRVNPHATVVPNSSNPSKAIGDELMALKADIGTPEWYASPEKQARYKELLAAQESFG